MSRPINYAIKYFPMMVDIADDPKILKAESLMGDKALDVFPIAVKLLCWIYGKEGYFIEWDEDVAVIFAKRMFNVGHTDIVSQVVTHLITTKFFDKGMYDKYKILTSHGIQVQWKKVIDSVKGKAVVASKYKIIVVSDDINSNSDDIPSEETMAETESMRQSKVNESKVNESKVTYLHTAENSKNEKTPDQTPSLVPAPKIDPGLAAFDDDSHLPLEQCVDYIFRSKKYEEKLYKICFGYHLHKKNTEDHDYDKLFAWARCFNRFIGTTTKKKTIKGWLTHFENWLPQQPIEINPDDLNMKNNGTKSATTKGPKILGNDHEKAGDFYNRPTVLPGDNTNSETRT